MTSNITNDMLETPASISGQILKKLDHVADYFKDNAGELLWNLMMIAAILILAKLALYLISRGTKSAMQKQMYHRSEKQGKRIDTMMTLLRSAARYVVYFIAILLILKQFNLFESMKGLIVTAGVGSFAIGFGAQSLVKDVVTGFFMMFENQFSVGDYIKTDNFEGTVEATAMRVTYLRTFKGEQVIIPNGTISRVVNYSRGDNVAIITVSTSYEADTQKIMQLIEQAVKQYASKNMDVIKEPPVVQGITAFESSSVQISVMCKVHSMKQWQVERGMRLAVKEMFDKSGVAFPYPRIVKMDYTPEKKLTNDDIPKGKEKKDKIPEWANIEDDE